MAQPTTPRQRCTPRKRIDGGRIARHPQRLEVVRTVSGERGRAISLTAAGAAGERPALRHPPRAT